MRRHLVHFVALSLSLSILSYGQSWSNVLSSSRAINWANNVGLPASFTDKGGSNIETTPNPWTPPTRTQSGSTINPSGSATTDLNNINTALTNCADGTYVLLGAGTFLIQNYIAAYQHSCTLRGSGAQSTTLAMTNAGTIWVGAAGTGGSCNLTSGSNYAAGSTSITCNGLTGAAPVVGYIVSLTQCDTGFSGSSCTTGASADNGGLFVCSFQTTCMTEPSGSGGNVSQEQLFVITSVSNSSGTYTIGLNAPLYMPNWAYSQTPKLNWNNFAYDGVGVGIEDMTIYYSGTSSTNWSVQMQNTFASWVKGVRFVGTAAAQPLYLNETKSNLISNNYCFADIALDGNYPPCIESVGNSDTLVLNNIITYGTYEVDGGHEGDVNAYNYEFFYFTSYSLNTIYDHHAHDAFRLEEGNENTAGYGDDTWGTHDLYTFFRNYFTCYDKPYTAYGTNAQVAFSIGAYQRFHNAIGNAIGSSECTSYTGAWPNATGVLYRVDSSVDPLSSVSFMRWGNVSTVTQSSDTPTNSGIRFVASEVPNSTNMPSSTYPNAVTWQNSTPGTTSLPCSMFLSGYTSTTCTAHPSGDTGLSWWKVCKTWTTFPTNCAATQTQPFPFAGPDVSSGPYVGGYAYDNPARIAWQNLPVDTTYQHSYTISSSSWAGGVETLTFAGSVLPNTTHLMGPFQLSGVNAACSAGATFNSSNEIMITGSSSITVQYALTSNPGTSCTGTMLFPDVRQFDERVYQNDSGSGTSGTSVSSPTGLSATAK